jgi:hypothetical protein
MPPIERDPHLEVCPDFASDHYTPLRTLIINAGSTEEEAVLQISNAWQQENQARREDWNRQIEDEQRDREEADQLARQQEQEEQDRARREKEKKKPKIGDFEANRSVSSFIPPRPSSYALNKLESFEYVELFYFTLEGCLDAQSNQRTEADDAYGLSRVGDMVSFRSISAVRASKNVIQDVDLSWNQLTHAKTSYLQHLGKAGWPQKHIDALAHFFIGLESSPFRNRTHGERILITYQARVRRHWHDRLKQDDDGSFNIALINDNLLEAIANEIWDGVHTMNKREVSLPPPPAPF